MAILTPEQLESRRAYAREYYHRNKAQQQATAKSFRERHPEYSREYYLANREEHLDRISRRQKEKKGERNAATRKYQAAKLSATPPWLSAEHLRTIEGLYIEAARLTEETGVPYEVDHIVPLQGRKVRGLHVPWNLRVIERTENRRKGRAVI